MWDVNYLSSKSDTGWSWITCRILGASCSVLRCAAVQHSKSECRRSQVLRCSPNFSEFSFFWKFWFVLISKADVIQGDQEHRENGKLLRSPWGFLCNSVKLIEVFSLQWMFGYDNKKNLLGYFVQGEMRHTVSDAKLELSEFSEQGA